MRCIAADVEANGWADTADKIWLFGGIDVNTGERYEFQPWRSQEETRKAIDWAKTVDLWVFHNGLSYDGPVCNRLLGDVIPLNRIVDTLIISRTVKYDRYTPPGCRSGHSLKAHGIRLGIHKSEFDKFDEYSEEMREYWLQDLEVQFALYNDFKRFIWDPEWKKAFRVEHDIQISLDQQTAYGFAFDTEKASSLRSSVEQQMGILEKEIAEDYPPKLEHVKTINYTIKKDGEEGAHVQKAKQDYPLAKVEGDKLLCYDYVPFKPGSPKDRIEALWEAGWKPHEKTKTHQQFSRTKPGQDWGKTKRMTEEFWQAKKDHFDIYGWTCSEDNLATLPAKAPAGARKLAQWLTLEGRRSSLVEWLGQVKDDGRVHGRVMHIGAWTGRMSHSDPNTANISSVWPEKKPAKTAVDEIKKKYDTAMRSCWKVPDGKVQVGTDAAGIQLRILADYLARHFDAHDYIEAIVSGRKEDDTDIHNMNRKALGIPHVDRDMAKTYAYAWLLGAGDAKIGSILHVPVPQARAAKDRFERSINGLYRLKNELLPYIAERGWFTGYDGRKVIVPNLHKTLAGILQAGEAVVMKHWVLRVNRAAEKEGLGAHMLGVIHDETQHELPDMGAAKRFIEIQHQCIKEVEQDLGFICPLEIEAKTGFDWAQCH